MKKISPKTDIIPGKISPINDKRILHHIIYQLPDKKKRQGDLTIKLSPGAHTVITDVQYSIAKDDLNAGLCLIFEGLKRVITVLQEN